MSIGSTASNSEPIVSLLRSAGGTDKGAKRDYNADAFTSIESNNFKLFLVADGVGGPNKGAVAANLALSTVKEVLKNKKRVNLSDLRDAVREANDAIHKKGAGETELGGMGTTLVGLAFVDSRAYIVNVGNSRAYRIRGSKISRLTIDTTVAQLLQDSPKGAAGEDAAKATASHMLTRCLGTKDRVEVDGAPLPEQPQVGDLYLLCTDGLYDLVLEKELVDAFASRDIDEAVEHLIALANQRGGHDNITLCVVSVDKGEAKPRAEQKQSRSEQKQPRGEPKQQKQNAAELKPKGKGPLSFSKEIAAELPIPPEAQPKSLFSPPPVAPPAQEEAPKSESKDSADLLAAMLEKKRKEIREKLLAKSKGEGEADTPKAEDEGQKQKDSVNKDIESLKRALSSIQSKATQESEKQEPAQAEKKDPHAELKARIAALSERVAAEKEKALSDLAKKRAATEEAQAAKSQEGKEVSGRGAGDAVPLRRTLDPKGPRQIPDLDKKAGPKGAPSAGGKRPLLSSPPPVKKRSFSSRLGVALVIGLVVGGIIASQLTSFDTTQISQNVLGVKEKPIKPVAPAREKTGAAAPRAEEIEATRLFAQKLTDAELADILRLTREAADQNAREAARIAKGIPVRDTFDLAPEGLSYIRNPGHKMMFLEVYSAIREAVAASDKRLEVITLRQERIGQVLTRLSETIELSKAIMKPEEAALNDSSRGIVVSQASDEITKSVATAQ